MFKLFASLGCEREELNEIFLFRIKLEIWNTLLSPLYHNAWNSEGNYHFEQDSVSFCRTSERNLNILGKSLVLSSRADKSGHGNVR